MRNLTRLAPLLLAALTAWAGCSKDDGAPARGPGAAAATRPASNAAAPAASAPAPKIEIDRKARRVVVPAVAARQGMYAELKGAIEYLLVATGGKEYETIFTTPFSPREIHEAFAAVGLTDGSPGTEEAEPRGKPVRILVEHASPGGPVRRAADEFVLRAATGKPLTPAEWVYTGSPATTDPATGKQIIQAELTRSVVGLHRADPSPLVQNPRDEAKRENIYRANVAALPPAGTPVRLVFERVMPTIAPGTRRVRALISGRVQGVGFRAFTRHQAAGRKLAGFVRNLDDGRVEAVLEGPAAQVDELLAELRRGPRPARVENVEVSDEQPEGDVNEFEVRY